METAQSFVLALLDEGSMYVGHQRKTEWRLPRTEREGELSAREKLCFKTCLVPQISMKEFLACEMVYVGLESRLMPVFSARLCRNFESNPKL